METIDNDLAGVNGRHSNDIQRFRFALDHAPNQEKFKGASILRIAAMKPWEAKIIVCP